MMNDLKDFKKQFKIEILRLIRKFLNITGFELLFLMLLHCFLLNELMHLEIRNHSSSSESAVVTRTTLFNRRVITRTTMASELNFNFQINPVRKL